MKKLISISVFVLSFFIFPSFSFARDVAITPNQTRQNIREMIQDKINLFQEKNTIRQQNRETTPTGNTNRNQYRYERAKAIINRLIKGIETRYQNTLDFKARIEARIAKIEKLNETATVKRDMTAAKAKLATFDTTEYLKDLAAFNVQKEAILASTTPLKLTPELKSLAKELQSDIKALRTILADTLRLIIKA